jgi:micrococcal nuclease
VYIYNAEVVRVVDGDTLDLMVDLGFTVHVKIRARLLGVDTPETFGVKKGSAEHTAGTISKQGVEGWLNACNRQVRIHSTKGTGKYGRWLVKVFRPDDEVTLNDFLIKEGLAEVYDGGKR